MKNNELQELKPVYIHEARYSADGEISLVDLAAMLARHKTMIASIIAIFIVLGITKALLTPKQYTVSTTIEIGSQIIESQAQHFDSPQNLLAKLQHSFIPSTLNTYQLSNPNNKNKYIIRPSIPSSSVIVVLEMEGTEDEVDLMTTLLQDVNQKIFQDHDRVYNSVKQNLVAMISQAKAELATLNSNDEIQIEERKLLEGQIKIYNLQLANLQKTRSISPPMKSIHPTGTGKKLILALALFAGAFFAVFTAFLAEFIKRVKEAE